MPPVGAIRREGHGLGRVWGSQRLRMSAKPKVESRWRLLLQMSVASKDEKNIQVGRCCRFISCRLTVRLVQRGAR